MKPHRCEACNGWVSDWKEIKLGDEWFEVCFPCAAIIEGPPRELPLGHPLQKVVPPSQAEREVPGVCPTCARGNGKCERIPPMSR